MEFLKAIESLSRRLGELVSPTYCVICGTAHELICTACTSSLQRTSWSLPSGLRVSAPIRAAPEFMQAVALWKDSGVRRLTCNFARLVANTAISCGFSGYDLLVIPSRNAPRRGWSPSAELAKAVAEHLGVQVYTTLIVASGVKEQRGLNDAQRRLNLQHAFSLAKLPQRSFVLFDDVCTSGASLLAAEAACIAAGVRPAAGLVLAKSRY